MGHPFDIWYDQYILNETPYLSIRTKESEFAVTKCFDESGNVPLPAEEFVKVVNQLVFTDRLIVRWDKLLGIRHLKAAYNVIKHRNDNIGYSLFCGCLSAILNYGEPFNPCGIKNHFDRTVAFLNKIENVAVCMDDQQLLSRFEEYRVNLRRIFSGIDDNPDLLAKIDWMNDVDHNEHAVFVRQLAQLDGSEKLFSIWTTRSQVVLYVLEGETMCPASLQEWTEVICNRPYLIIEMGKSVNILIRMFLISVHFRDVINCRIKIYCHQT